MYKSVAYGAGTYQKGSNRWIYQKLEDGYYISYCFFFIFKFFIKNYDTTLQYSK